MLNAFARWIVFALNELYSRRVYIFVVLWKLTIQAASASVTGMLEIITWWFTPDLKVTSFQRLNHLLKQMLNVHWKDFCLSSLSWVYAEYGNATWAQSQQ